ncbi:MAG: ExbD/TolR family protein [Gammaproteobacteria bacterium]
MNLRPRKDDDVELNLTPLIDVVFLLLIFFMVSTTFVKESEIKLDLPEATTAAAPSTKEAIKISIDAKGNYFLNGEPLINTQAETVEKAIKLAAGDNKEPTIVINADKQATHQSVVAVLDAARRLKFLRITFATERKKDDK